MITRNVGKNRSCCSNVVALQNFLLQELDKLSIPIVSETHLRKKILALQDVYEAVSPMINADHKRFEYTHFFHEADVTFTFDVSQLAFYQNRVDVIKASIPPSVLCDKTTLIYQEDTVVTAGFPINEAPVFLVPFFSKSLLVDGNHRLVAHIATNIRQINYCIFPVSIVAECLGDTFQKYLYLLIMDLTNAFDWFAINR